jgi:NAD+ diphosphatase
MNFRAVLHIDEEDRAKKGLWFLFHGDELVVGPGGCLPTAVSAAELPAKPGELHVVGTVDGAPVFAAEIDRPDELLAGHSLLGLRQTFSVFGEEVFQLAGRARQILTWDRDHRFCGRCGAPMVRIEEERARRCPECGHNSFPRLAPAMITAVVRGWPHQGRRGGADESAGPGEESGRGPARAEERPRILLARARRFPPGLFSVLAGFVEAGESLEECVRREICEEVGIEVCDIRYFGSQSWPFPHSLMVGFTARYASGEITIDRNEIEEACWFAPDELPEVPSRASISRRLIDWFVESCG